MSVFHLHTRSKTLTPLANYIVNDALVRAMPNIQQMLLQFVNTVQLGLIGLYSLLDVNPYSEAKASVPGTSNKLGD